MAMQRTGDWERVGQMIRNINRDMSEAQKVSLMRFGLKIEAVAKKHIENQQGNGLGWTPLKDLTIARKIHKGYSENILVESSTYAQSITSWVSGDTVYAGVKKAVYEDDGVTEVADIAAVHEFGSRSGAIPARPLWRPTFDQVLKWHTATNSPYVHFLRIIKRKYGI